MACFVGGLGGGNDLFLIRSDLRIFTMASSFSMGGGKCRGCSGGGGDGVAIVDCTFCFFFSFFFFGLGDVSAFRFCVRVGSDGSDFFGVGGRKCCVIFVFCRLWWGSKMMSRWRFYISILSSGCLWK